MMDEIKESNKINETIILRQGIIARELVYYPRNQRPE
jgi:hypothetical protein